MRVSGHRPSLFLGDPTDSQNSYGQLVQGVTKTTVLVIVSVQERKPRIPFPAAVWYVWKTFSRAQRSNQSWCLSVIPRKV